MRRAVAAIISNSEGNVLFSQRGPESSRYQGMWEFPGGTLLEDETPVEGVIRELQEELGISVAGEPKVLCMGLHENSGVEWHTVTFLVKSFIGTPLIKEPGKAVELRFLNPDHPPEPLIPEARTDLVAYLNATR